MLFVFFSGRPMAFVYLHFLSQVGGEKRTLNTSRACKCVFKLVHRTDVGTKPSGNLYVNTCLFNRLIDVDLYKLLSALGLGAINYLAVNFDTRLYFSPFGFF